MMLLPSTPLCYTDIPIYTIIITMQHGRLHSPLTSPPYATNTMPNCDCNNVRFVSPSLTLLLRTHLSPINE